MLIINIAGLALIALIVWWFWLYKPKEAVLTDSDIVIKVENGVYQPSRLKIAADTPKTLYFQRMDPSPCAETVQFPDLEISATLALNEKVPIAIPALAPGKYAFHCQMQMYKGELHVE